MNKHYSADTLPSSFEQFLRQFPAFEQTSPLDSLREAEYGRLDRTDQVYLDYTGGGLHADSQIHTHTRLLTERVLGNPHSNNPTSLAMTELVESARRYVLQFFNASPDEYICVFTANASAALKLVGESYCFEAGGRFALTFDNHNSVNGIREFARAKGAEITYVPIVAPELRIDAAALRDVLHSADTSKRNLFALPAQSNFSGVQHALDWIAEAGALGWDVLLDCAAYAPTNRLDLSVTKPCFAAFSFYKMFGFPTGIGALLINKNKLGCLKRPWFAGGTIQIASVQGDGHYLHEDEAAFEDGTVDYLNIPAVETGLRHLDSINIDVIHERVVALTGWLLEALQGLRHENGRQVVHILGPTDTTMRGGTVTFCVADVDGRPIDDQRVEELANRVNISLRTGCFCNPGAGEVAHGLDVQQMITFFEDDHALTFAQLRDEVLARYDKSVSAVRVSVGIASNFADCYRFLCFMQTFIDKTVAEIGDVEFKAENCRVIRDAA